MALELVDILQGSFSLIFVCISLVIGITILSKYSQHKSRLYILVGLSWIGIANPYFPDSISFVMNILFQQSLAVEWYLIIGNVFIPIALLCWLTAYTDMINKKRQPLVVSLTVIFSILFEFAFFFLFFTDITQIGVIVPSRPFTVEFGLFLTIYLLLIILILLITGIKFSQKSIRSKEKDIRLKGKLLRAAFITFAIAAIFDSLLGTIFEDPTDPLLAIMVVVTRLL
ncbi:MAG: hypothetical protein MUP85_22185, partial [Candidatus Lokiarchaeota archaeon]|nr:hypothetical protein [Candidatus Lokiarchaeota archaeon]